MSRSRRALLAVLLGVAAAGVHLGALDCGFIAYDDDAYVYENPHLRGGFSRDSVRWAFTAHLTHDALPHLDYWQPLTVFSRLLDVELFGLDPRGHHATNLLLHGLNAALLFLVLETMTGAPWRSAFVAAVFGLHPLRVESVVWVTERKDVLSGLFWMLALVAYVRYVRRPRRLGYAVLVALFVLGLMAKPILVVLPFVLLLLDYWPLRRVGPEDWRRLRALVAEKLPLFVLALASLIITVVSHMRGVFLAPLGSQPLTTGVGNALVDYVRCATRFAWPQPMALPQPFPLHPWSPWLVAACAGVLLTASAVACWQARRRPYLAVGWFWFLGTLAPAIALVQSGAQPLADRFTYIPHIGLAIAVAWGFADVSSRLPSPVRWMAPGAVAVLGALAATTVGQTRHWRDSVSLFRHAVETTSDNFAAHFNLGNALAGKGRHEDAAAQYRRTIAILPAHARAHNNLANLLAAQGRTDEAIRHYEEALRILPGYVDAHNNLGVLLFDRNENNEARRHYMESLRAHPRHLGALHNLGRLEAREGRVREALEVLAAAIDADPGFAPAYATRGGVLARAGRLADAERDYRSAVRLQPSDADSRNNLGRALALLGRPDEAMIEYEAAARIAPEHPLVHVNIGRLLLARGRPEEAVSRLQEALRLRPQDAEAHLELGHAMSRLGRPLEACAEYAQALRLDPRIEEARTARQAGRCPPRGAD